MAGLFTSVTLCGGGSHATLVSLLDAVSVSILMTEQEALIPLTEEDQQLLMRLAARRLRQQGVPLTAWVNRAYLGDEATNVKFYNFFGPGALLTKTNIGTAYVNIPLGLNGERIVVDFTGCTEFRLLLSANLIGTGAFGLRCIRDGDSEVLIENANLGAAGERELDSDWLALPAAFLGTGLTFLLVQAKSATAADDPVFRRCQLGLR